MKILIICQYYYPEQFLINDIAPELVKRGNNVTVLTGRPNYPDGIVKKGYSNYEEKNGVKIIRCFEIGRRKGLIYNYLSFMISSCIKVNKLDKDFDVVFVYQLSPITMALPAIKYKKKNKDARLLLYCLDIWPESAKAHIRGIGYKLISNLSKKIYNKFDEIMVTSKPFIDYLNNINNVNKEKMVYIPQHAVGDLLDKDLSNNDDCVDFMYAGNFGAGQTLDVIINALKLVDRNYKMHFVGSGSKEKELKELVIKYDLNDKVIFHGQKKYVEMEEMYRLADALIITLRGNNAVGDTMPGKLQTYMSAGKPIFGAINGAANEVIKESNCGACVKAGDYEGLSKLFVDFIDNKEKYKDCGKNARKYFKENFTFDIFMNKFEEELNNVKNK